MSNKSPRNLYHFLEQLLERVIGGMGLLGMMIESVVNQLQKRLVFSPYFVPFILAEPIIMCMNIEREQYWYRLGEGSLQKVHQQANADLTLVGELEEMLLFLKGGEPLRRLVKQGRISVHGKYRDVLRLESVVYCTVDKERSVI